MGNLSSFSYLFGELIRAAAFLFFHTDMISRLDERVSEGDLAGVGEAGVAGDFENEGEMDKVGVVDELRKPKKADLSFTQIGVLVVSRIEVGFAIV